MCKKHHDSNFDESFQWDECFVTGLTEIDEQHHHLVNVINHFGKLVRENDKLLLDEIEKVFKDLTDYSEYHFKEEESLMKKASIYEHHYKHHCREHLNFLREIQQIKKSLSNSNPNSAKSLLKFLIHWLAYHILGLDQSMAKQIFAIQNGVSSYDAYTQEVKQKNGATGPLLRALNGLFHQVSERNRELSLLNQTLEEKVAERTQELLEANQKLEDMALTDVLTGLPNRRHAMKRFTKCWTESINENKPLSCMMVDADNFKQINDTQGHDAGDEVLRQLSRKLKESIRTDDVVCRLGGDEFIILCQNTPLDGAMLLAEKIRQEVSNLQISVGNGKWIGSISIGVASRQDDMKVLEDLIKVADNGVYIAKKNGRNFVGSAQLPS